MVEYFIKLYFRYKERLEDLSYACYLAGVIGFAFRMIVNQLLANTGLVKTGIPYDEFFRPLAVYLSLWLLDKLLRKLGIIDDSTARRYIPQTLTLIGWCGIWEGSEYLTDLPKVIKGISPTILGTIKDWIMDAFAVLSYESKLRKS